GDRHHDREAPTGRNRATRRALPARQRGSPPPPPRSIARPVAAYRETPPAAATSRPRSPATPTAPPARDEAGAAPATAGRPETSRPPRSPRRAGPSKTRRPAART